MNGFVLGASVSAAWFLPHPDTEYALEVRQKLADGSKALVPGLWPLEMANALARAARKNILTTEAADYAIRQLEILFLSGPRIEIEGGIVSVRQAYTAARTLQLTAYDGVYVELAQREGLPLATLDKDMRAAAKKVGVELLT
ncbi:MAG: type II toxin-antitoxin system VapC family toxin [Candidatus Acidiferrales bacterium]